MKKALVRNRRHMNPMCAVLKRYGIGEPDQYDRGLWIKESDLPAILACMKNDKTKIEDGKGERYQIFVNGTCMHNHAGFHEFQRLFNKEV